MVVLFATLQLNVLYFQTAVLLVWLFVLGLSLLVLLSFYVRKRIGQKTWRRLHYVSFLAFLAATAHGLMAGTDTSAPWVVLGYLLMTAIVVFLLTYRIVLAMSARPAAGASTVTARSAGR